MAKFNKKKTKQNSNKNIKRLLQFKMQRNCKKKKDNDINKTRAADDDYHLF